MRKRSTLALPYYNGRPLLSFKYLFFGLLIGLTALRGQAQSTKTFSFSCGGPTYMYTGDYMSDTESPYSGFVTSHPNSHIFVAGPADPTYNCHAFAWANDKSVWVQTFGGSTQAPEYYYNVGCYVQTTQADAEIVVYGSISSPIHSAVRITNSTNGFGSYYLSQYPQYAGWFVSKWDGGPIVIHAVDSCPYYFDVIGIPPTYYKKSSASSTANNIKGSNYSITGTKVVCAAGSQFTLSCGTPKSFTVTWSSSSNITIANVNAYPVTASATGAGTSGWIKATLNFPDGTSDTVTRIPVWMGVPTYISSISTNQFTPGGTGYIPITVPASGVDYYAWPFNTGDVVPPNGNIDSHGASSYSWTSSGLTYTDNPVVVGYRYAAGYFTGHGSATLTVHASNACGTTTAFQALNVTSSGFSVRMSPNPASDQVTVNLAPANKNGQPAPQKAVTSEPRSAAPASGPAVPAAVSPVTYTVRIIDMVGTVYYTTKKTGDNFTVPVSNLKSGNYVLEISDGKTVSSKPLVVAH
jgi:hypothetical protein